MRRPWRPGRINSSLDGDDDHGLLDPASLLNDDHPQYSLTDGSRAFTGTGAGFRDEDDMVSDDATAAASQQSIKAYVGTVASAYAPKSASYVVTALDGTLTNESLLTGGTGIDVTGSSVAIDSTVALTAATQTLTSKTISGASNTLSAIPYSALANATAGDLLFWNGGAAAALLAKGSNGQVLELSSGLPSWQDAYSDGDAREAASVQSTDTFFTADSPITLNHQQAGVYTFVSADSGLVIEGITAPGVGDSTWFVFENLSAVNLTIEHLENAAATDIILPSGADVVLQPGDTFTAHYNVLYPDGIARGSWVVSHLSLAAYSPAAYRHSVTVGDDLTVENDLTMTAGDILIPNASGDIKQQAGGEHIWDFGSGGSSRAKTSAVTGTGGVRTENSGAFHDHVIGNAFFSEAKWRYFGPTTDSQTQGAEFYRGATVGTGLGMSWRANGHFYFREAAAAPTSPSLTANTDAYLYFRNDRLIIKYNDAGTNKWWSLDLTGTADASWEYDTAEP